MPPSGDVPCWVRPSALQVSCPQRTSGDLGGEWLISPSIQYVERPVVHCFCPCGVVKIVRHHHDLKAKVVVIRNVNQAMPRAVLQERYGKNGLEMARFCALTRFRHTRCRFRFYPRPLKRSPELFCVRVISNN